MFGIERDPESDMLRVWHMVQELGEQLSHNQKLVAQLKSQAVNLKVSLQNAPLGQFSSLMLNRIK